MATFRENPYGAFNYIVNLQGDTDGQEGDFVGAFSGQALLIFPEANSLELVRAVTGGVVAPDQVEGMEQEAPGLFRCDANGFMMAPPPVGTGDRALLLAFAFRPLVWQAQAGELRKAA